MTDLIAELAKSREIIDAATDGEWFVKNIQIGSKTKPINIVAPTEHRNKFTTIVKPPPVSGLAAKKVHKNLIFISESRTRWDQENRMLTKALEFLTPEQVSEIKKD